MTVNTYHEAVSYLKAGTAVTVVSILPDGTEYKDEIDAVPRLVIAGCGHVGVCTAKLGKELGYHVILTDPRPEYADPNDHPYADEVICASYEQLWECISDTEETYYVLTVGEPEVCYTTASAALKRKGVYVGLLGSRKKLTGVRERLLKSGFSEDFLNEKFHAPIGLPIGGERPMEVALSIMAEITQVRSAGRHKELEEDILEYLCCDAQGSSCIDTGASESKESSVGISKESDVQRDSAIMAVIMEVQGTAPRTAGSRMLVLGRGTILGTVGGGEVEHQAKQYALRMLMSDNASDDAPQDAAVIECMHGNHGKVKILLRRV